MDSHPDPAATSPTPSFPSKQTSQSNMPTPAASRSNISTSQSSPNATRSFQPSSTTNRNMASPPNPSSTTAVPPKTPSPLQRASQVVFGISNNTTAGTPRDSQIYPPMQDASTHQIYSFDNHDGNMNTPFNSPTKTPPRSPSSSLRSANKTNVPVPSNTTGPKSVNSQIQSPVHERTTSQAYSLDTHGKMTTPSKLPAAAFSSSRPHAPHLFYPQTPRPSPAAGMGTGVVNPSTPPNFTATSTPNSVRNFSYPFNYTPIPRSQGHIAPHHYQGQPQSQGQTTPQSQPEFQFTPHHQPQHQTAPLPQHLQTQLPSQLQQSQIQPPQLQQFRPPSSNPSPSTLPTTKITYKNLSLHYKSLLSRPPDQKLPNYSLDDWTENYEAGSCNGKVLLGETSYLGSLGFVKSRRGKGRGGGGGRGGRAGERGGGGRAGERGGEDQEDWDDEIDLSIAGDGEGSGRENVVGVDASASPSSRDSSVSDLEDSALGINDGNTRPDDIEPAMMSGALTSPDNSKNPVNLSNSNSSTKQTTNASTRSSNSNSSTRPNNNNTTSSTGPITNITIASTRPNTTTTTNTDHSSNPTNPNSLPHEHHGQALDNQQFDYTNSSGISKNQASR